MDEPCGKLSRLAPGKLDLAKTLPDRKTHQRGDDFHGALGRLGGRECLLDIGFDAGLDGLEELVEFGDEVAVAAGEVQP